MPDLYLYGMVRFGPSISTRRGPFPVTGRPVHTGIAVRVGDEIELYSTGRVNLGGGFLGLFEPVLTADGDGDHLAPPDYPAPHLNKNSLICQIGGKWYQGGSSLRFAPNTAGELVLACNDAHPGDNTLAWNVHVTHHQAIRPISTDGPRLNIAWAELVQVIQRRDGSIPLIARKPTALRIFINSDLPDNSPMTRRVDNIRGEVVVGSTTITFNGASAHSAGTHQRNDPSHAIAVRLPPLSGKVKLLIRAAADGHNFGEPRWSAELTVEADFVELQKLQLRPLLLGHPGTREPSLAEFGRVLDLALARLPLTRDAITLAPYIALPSWDLGGPPGWYATLATITALTAITPINWAVTDGILAGIVHSPHPTNSFPGGLALPFPRRVFISRVDELQSDPDKAARLFAHELYHAAGLFHAPPPHNCGAGWPHDFDIGGRIDEPGFDVANMTLLPADATPDLMGYCGGAHPQWPSTATYLKLLRRAT